MKFYVVIEVNGSYSSGAKTLIRTSVKVQKIEEVQTKPERQVEVASEKSPERRLQRRISRAGSVAGGSVARGKGAGGKVPGNHSAWTPILALHYL